MKKAAYEDQPQFQNCIGPGGYKLDPSEAAAWFPELAEAPSLHPRSPTAGCAVLVEFGDMRFWLYNVEIGVEPGVYFGDIEQSLPDNAAHLDAGQNIGFEQRHVFDIEMSTSSTGPSGKS